MHYNILHNWVIFRLEKILINSVIKLLVLLKIHFGWVLDYSKAVKWGNDKYNI